MEHFDWFINLEIIGTFSDNDSDFGDEIAEEIPGMFLVETNIGCVELLLDLCAECCEWCVVVVFIDEEEFWRDLVHGFWNININYLKSKEYI
jgi:hypothetical protein